MFPIDFNWKFACLGTYLVLAIDGLINLAKPVPTWETALFSTIAVAIGLLIWSKQKMGRTFSWAYWFSAISGIVVSSLLLWLQ